MNQFSKAATHHRDAIKVKLHKQEMRLHDWCVWCCAHWLPVRLRRCVGMWLCVEQLGELTEAEDALTEANALNSSNAEVWGYLSLVCLQVHLLASSSVLGGRDFKAAFLAPRIV